LKQLQKAKIFAGYFSRRTTFCNCWSRHCWPLICLHASRGWTQGEHSQKDINIFLNQFLEITAPTAKKGIRLSIKSKDILCLDLFLCLGKKKGDSVCFEALILITNYNKHKFNPKSKYRGSICERPV